MVECPGAFLGKALENVRDAEHKFLPHLPNQIKVFRAYTSLLSTRRRSAYHEYLETKEPAAGTFPYQYIRILANLLGLQSDLVPLSKARSGLRLAAGNVD